MRIVHFLYDSPENPWLGGGGAIRAQEINKRLVTMGHEVHMICGSYPGCHDADWIVDGVHWHSCGKADRYWWSRLAFTLGCRSYFRRFILQSPVELVIEDFSPFSVIAARCVWSGPHIAVIQNWMGTRIFEKLGFIGIPFLLLEWYQIKRFRKIIAVSQSISSQIHSINKYAQIQVVYNGVQDCFLLDRTTEIAVIPNSILFVGRLDIFQKGLDVLLNAFTRICEANPEAKLWIIGSGKDEEKFKEMLRSHPNYKRIDFLGRMGDERIDWVAKSEVVVMPSRFEGWGIVALEAAAQGKPVVGTNIEGLSEAIINEQTGLLVSHHAIEFAQAVNRLLKDKELGRRLGARARLRAITFSWDHQSKEQGAFYKLVREGV